MTNEVPEQRSVLTGGREHSGRDSHKKPDLIWREGAALFTDFKLYIYYIDTEALLQLQSTLVMHGLFYTSRCKTWNVPRMPRLSVSLAATSICPSQRPASPDPAANISEPEMTSKQQKQY